VRDAQKIVTHFVP